MASITRLEDIGRENVPWTIDGIMSGLTLLWGRAGIGKSFVAMSMAASVAAGRPWMGRHTQHGQVVYIAGEGGLVNVGHRLRTALDQWHVRDSLEGELVDLSVVTPGVDLVAQPEELVGLIENHTNLQLLVVDTLNRCMIGDENKQEIMGRFIHSLDLIKDRFKCSVLVIHHANKQDEIRGSSVLFGAADVSWHLTETTLNTATHDMKADKLKERDAGNGSIQMRLIPTNIVAWDGGAIYDELGAVQTTLIVKPTIRIMEKVRSVSGIGKALLEKSDIITYDQWYGGTDNVSTASFANSLSYILSYPGMWGIERRPGIGKYGRAR